MIRRARAVVGALPMTVVMTWGIAFGRFPAIPSDAKAAELLFEIAGEAHATSGDTLEISGRRIRLGGIDAPELEQECRHSKGKPYPCGKIAMRRLSRLVSGQEVRCKGDTRDVQHQLLAHCAVGPLSLNELMVASGWALADPKTGAEYTRAEGAAKARREGLWRGQFENPWEWRKKTE